MRHPVNAAESFDLFMRDVRGIKLLTTAEEIKLAKVIEAGIYAKHLLDTDESITGQLASDLRILVDEGVQAKKDFVESNIRLVISIAKKYIASGIEMGELIHDGVLGLIRAVEKFDYRAGIKFSTYATYWIRQFIYRKKPEYMHIVHLPPNVNNALHKIRATTKELETKLGRTPNDEELANLIGVASSEVRKMRSYNQPWLSFQYTNSFDDGDSRDSIEGCLIPDGTPGPDVIVENASLGAVINQALSRLNGKQLKVVELRFGMVDGIEKSYREISLIMNLPQGAVRRTLESAIQLMSKHDKPALMEYYACR